MTVITSSPTQFGKLLELQNALLNQSITQTIIGSKSEESLRTIRDNSIKDVEDTKKIIETLKADSENKRAEELAREMLEMQKAQAEEAKKNNENIKRLGEQLKKQSAEEAKIVASLANDVRVFKKPEKEGSKLTLSNTLDFLGIAKKGSGSFLSNMVEKRDARKNYVKEQKMLGSDKSDKELSKMFDSQQKAAGNVQANEAKIEKFKKMGLNESQIAKTAEGKKLLENRESLTKEYSKYDLKSNLLKSDSGDTSEKEMEQAAVQEKTLGVLEQIAANTSEGKNGQAAKVTPTETKKEGGGLLDGIMDMFGSGFMKAIKSIFNPSTILKSLGKVFAIGAIIGALWEGLTDGFDEFMKTGDIGKAIVAGLAGIVDFLTFGLFDKEQIKEVIGDMAAWLNDHVVKPVSEFFGSMKDNFLALISNIGLPEIKFKIPVIDKEISIGPFYPFKGSSDAAKPKAPEPAAATQVEQKSAANAEAAAKPAESSNNTNVVAPTVNNVTKQTQVIKSPVRNQDSTVNSYLTSRYA